MALYKFTYLLNPLSPNCGISRSPTSLAYEAWDNPP